MRGSVIKTRVLCVQVIPNADASLLEKLNAPKGHRSLGLITTDCDDASYVAIDEATKKAQVEVVYAKSFYAGAKNAGTRLAGEFIGIFSAEDPENIKSALEAAVKCLENDAFFQSADDEDSIVYFAHCVSSCGSYLAQMAKVPQGTAIAYLIAPPAEAMVAVDAAVKAAETSMAVFYGPPTETNFAGALLTGEQSACRAACEAFAQAVAAVADDPVKY